MGQQRHITRGRGEFDTIRQGEFAFIGNAGKEVAVYDPEEVAAVNADGNFPVRLMKSLIPRQGVRPFTGIFRLSTRGARKDAQRAIKRLKRPF